MIELLDPKKIDPVAYDSGLLEEIKEFSLLPNGVIGWNYCMDYSWMVKEFEKYVKPGMKIIDIGSGPGAIHGYLEDRYNVNIIGIDIHRWKKDYVDIVGDFTDREVRKKYNITPNSIDLIISISSFEHNKPKRHEQLVSVCLESLKPEGRLMTTFSASFSVTIRTANQWNLSRKKIEYIYGERFNDFNYFDVWKRWRSHREIPANHKKRYGKWFFWHPSFLSVGANVKK